MSECINVMSFFDAKALRQVRQIIEVGRSDQNTIKVLLDEVIMPRINQIDFATGLTNSPAYFAWRLLHTVRGMS